MAIFDSTRLIGILKFRLPISENVRVRRERVLLMAGFLPTSRARARFSIRLVDLVCVSAAPWLAFALRDPRFLGPPWINQVASYSFISVLVGAAILSWSGVGNIMCRYLSAADHRRLLLVAFTAVSITSMAAFSLTRLDAIPRTLPITHFFILGSLLIAARLVRGWRQQDQIDRPTARPKDAKNIIVVGANHVARFYIRLIEQCAFGRQRILAVIDPNPRLRNQTLAGHQVIGTPEDLPKIIHEYRTHGIEIHKLVVAMDELRLSEGAREFLRSAIAADPQITTKFLTERLGLSQESEPAAPQPQISEPADVLLPLNRGYWKLKRPIDILIAGSLLIVLAPVFGLVALAVRLGIGSPVIFWQRRVGSSGAGVFVYKFRTMEAPFDAQGRLRQELSGLRPIGAFLRRTRLDELPQLVEYIAWRHVADRAAPAAPGGSAFRQREPTSGAARRHGLGADSWRKPHHPRAEERARCVLPAECIILARCEDPVQDGTHPLHRRPGRGTTRRGFSTFAAAGVAPWFVGSFGPGGAAFPRPRPSSHPFRIARSRLPERLTASLCGEVRDKLSGAARAGGLPGVRSGRFWPNDGGHGTN